MAPSQASAIASELAGVLLKRAAEIAAFKEGEAAHVVDSLKKEHARLVTLTGNADSIETALSQAQAKLKTERETMAQAREVAKNVEEELRDAEQALEKELEMLRSQCREEIEKLPALGVRGSEEWIEWIGKWHLDTRGLALERKPDWGRYFHSLPAILDDAQKLLGPVFRLVHLLEPEGNTYGKLPEMLLEEQGAVQSLEEELRVVTGSFTAIFGQILLDVPDPTGVEDAAYLDACERILDYLEKILGRFAESARLESVTLEALS